jgi:hypothetical protein
MADSSTGRRSRRGLEHQRLRQLALTFKIEDGEISDLDLEDYH